MGHVTDEAGGNPTLRSTAARSAGKPQRGKGGSGSVAQQPWFVFSWPATPRRPPPSGPTQVHGSRRTRALVGINPWTGQGAKNTQGSALGQVFGVQG